MNISTILTGIVKMIYGLFLESIPSLTISQAPVNIENPKP